MNTDVDLENELLQLVVEELVSAGLQTPLREPILAAVESTPEERVEVVGPEGTAGTSSIDRLGDETGEEGTSDGESAVGESGSTARSPAAKAARRLAVLAVTGTVLYLAFRRVTGDDAA